MYYKNTLYVTIAILVHIKFSVYFSLKKNSVFMFMSKWYKRFNALDIKNKFKYDILQYFYKIMQYIFDNVYVELKDINRH